MEGLQLLKQQTLEEKVKQLFDTQGPLCNSEGFYNHEGECWNDALQMIFLYSDGIKEMVQKKLAEEPIDPTEVDGLFRPYVNAAVQQAINVKKNNNQVKDESLVQLGLMYISLVYEYLTTLQKRFYRHYLAESMRITDSDAMCSTQEKKGQLALEKLKQISLQFRGKGKEGLHSALFGKELQLKNITLKRQPSKLSNIYQPGGGPTSRQNVTDIFTRFFSLPIETNEYTNTLNFYGDRFQKDDTKENYQIKDTTIALYCGILIEGVGHAIAFYRCGGKSYLYDDNWGTIQFPWMGFFGLGLQKMTEAEKKSKKKWMKHHNMKYKTNQDNLVDLKFYFDATIIIRNEKDQVLFKSKNYPYAQSFLYEYNNEEDKIQQEFFVCLWTGKIFTLSTENSSFPLQFETTGETPQGETVSISVSIEKMPRRVMLMRFTTIDFQGTLPTYDKPSGIFLGSRIREYDPIVENVVFEQQVQKVLQGKAKVDELFFKEEYTLLTMAIENGDVEKVKTALELGADIHKLIRQESALFFAMTHEGLINLDVAQYLLDHGAEKDLNSNTNLVKGLTPLIGCILFNSEDEMADNVKFLLEKGAKADVPSKQNVLPIEYALFFSVPVEVYRLLFEHGAVAPKCPTKADLLKRIGSDSQVMHLIRQENIIQAGNLSKCYRIMDYEIYDDLDYENMIGETAVKLTLHLPQTEPSKKLLDMLLQNGADANHIDRFGTTPLYTAIQLGKLEFVKALIDNNANPNLVFEPFGTPIEYAKRLGHKEIVDYLEEKLRLPKYSSKRYKKQSTTRKQNRNKQNLSFVKRATKRAINKAKANV